MNNENTSENTTELLTELAEFMELYGHDSTADEMRELVYNMQLIEEAESIIRNS
jgi:hypothetical protein